MELLERDVERGRGEGEERNIGGREGENGGEGGGGGKACG